MNFKSISLTALMLKYRPITNKYIHNAVSMQPVANVLDFVDAVITITIQYPHIDVIMCWCTLRVCVCMHACMHVSVHV